MAMNQLYGEWDASYNKFQWWIAAMREYVPEIVVELHTLPYHDRGNQLHLGKIIFHQMFWTYTQILLITITQDKNKNILPVTFAIFEGKNLES
ncbi:hypothetical protein J1N35_038726 [Gossypium stocksii]|uniref:Uncharacterized protein n=1 Tax=Gossypium stocksii TaxID=47602 RepID=A0A9D3ZN32_9ROSI|nr:hypothetical protein J1N35_038726 [Gossypium stocksii]